MVRGCGNCRPNLHAAGGSAAPSSPSPLQVILSFCSLCVQILPAACIHCTHSVPCVLLYFCQLEKWDRCVSVCVRERVYITTYHCFLRSPCTCVCFFHCVESQQTTAVLSTGSCILSWSSTDWQQTWQKLPLASGPHLDSLISSDFNLSDPLEGSTSTLSWLSEHVFLNNDNMILYLNLSFRNLLHALFYYILR